MNEVVEESNQPALTPILSPREGLPAVVTTREQLVEVANALTNGIGPVAIDAERASGFRYSGRAYLVQLRRNGSGTHLIDPTGFENLELIQNALTEVDWVLHAASQDLVCLAEAGLIPTAQLFDTELAGRLLGLPKVGLGTLVESLLGFKLAKEHSAADWSKRPLPQDWLNYAALDVEFLLELWDVLEGQLKESNKFEIAMQEFAYVRDNTFPIVRDEPWRRTSGLHGARKPRQLAIVRELWLTREAIAQERDIAPGRVLPDSIIIEMTHEALENTAPIAQMKSLQSRLAARYKQAWVKAIEKALTMPEDELPATKVPTNAPPAPRLWQDRNPVAFAKLERVRKALALLSEQLEIPVENLMTPDYIRRVIWAGPTTSDEVDDLLTTLGAREWQMDLVGPIVKQALFQPPASDS